MARVSQSIDSLQNGSLTGWRSLDVAVCDLGVNEGSESWSMPVRGILPDV